ncbi:hypothetical protein KM043_003726 [Ampulex compressa]|nr:hypothetical protein KM043_003726 [Ampulex compressa]
MNTNGPRPIARIYKRKYWPLCADGLRLGCEAIKILTSPAKSSGEISSWEWRTRLGDYRETRRSFAVDMRDSVDVGIPRGLAIRSGLRQPLRPSAGILFGKIWRSSFRRL